ncbi:hypothetical protein LguiB_024137 [Lonicera macranthoides]
MPNALDEKAHSEASALTLCQVSSLPFSLSSKVLVVLSFHKHHITAKQHHLHKILDFFLFPFQLHEIDNKLNQEYGNIATKSNSLRILFHINCANGQ